MENIELLTDEQLLAEIEKEKQKSKVPQLTERCMSLFDEAEKRGLISCVMTIHHLKKQSIETSVEMGDIKGGNKTI